MTELDVEIRAAFTGGKLDNFSGAASLERALEAVVGMREGPLDIYTAPSGTVLFSLLRRIEA